MEEWLNPAPAERKAEQCVEQRDRELHGRYDEPSRMIQPLNCMLPLLWSNKHSPQSPKCGMQGDTLFENNPAI